MGTSKSTYKKFHPKKWPGIYCYEPDTMFNKKPDVSYHINYKVERKLIRDTVGKASAGYSPDISAEIRAGSSNIRYSILVSYAAKGLQGPSLGYGNRYRSLGSYWCVIYRCHVVAANRQFWIRAKASLGERVEENVPCKLIFTFLSPLSTKSPTCKKRIRKSLKNTLQHHDVKSAQKNGWKKRKAIWPSWWSLPAIY